MNKMFVISIAQINKQQNQQASQINLDNSVFVLQKKLTISYYGIIEIKLNKV